MSACRIRIGAGAGHDRCGFADDSSMSRLTGDSYAFFNNLDYHLGGFNTARAPQADATRVVKTPAMDKAKTAQRQAADPPATATRRIFHDDGGA